MPHKKNYITREGTFQSSSKQRAHIYYKHYQNEKWETSKKVTHIIFQHGMIEYHKRHEELFEFLLTEYKGALCISVMDLLGHGLSGGERAFVDDFSIFTTDYKFFCELCVEQLYKEKEVKTFLLSHSLGGLVTLKAFNEGNSLPLRPEAMVYINPCIKPKVEIPKFVASGASELPMTLKSLRLPLIYNAYDLTSDEQRALSFISDPLISKFITLQLGLETLKATKSIHSLSYFLKTPCYFSLSGQDKVVDVEKTQLFIAGMNKSLVKVDYHQQAKHDLLNETCRNVIFQEIMSYIELGR